MRFGLLILLATAAALMAGTYNEPPVRGSLDDLRSNAVYVLKESDGVGGVERLVPIDRPTHRIIHIADLHAVSFDDLAADLRDQDPTVSEDDIRAEHDRVIAAVRRVQRSQCKLLRWLSKYNGVRVVHLEGLTDADLPAYRRLVRALGTYGPDAMPVELGAVGQAMLAGYIDVAAAEDEAAYRAADPFAGDEVRFGGPANDAREAAIVRRLVASGPLSVVVLGGRHFLSQQVRAIGDCEYLRVTVEDWPED